MVIKSEQGPLRLRKAKIEKLDCAPFEVLIGESKHNFSFSSAILKVEASLSQKRKRIRNLSPFCRLTYARGALEYKLQNIVLFFSEYTLFSLSDGRLERLKQIHPMKFYSLKLYTAQFQMFQKVEYG